jgi:hypothetical protein
MPELCVSWMAECIKSLQRFRRGSATYRLLEAHAEHRPLPPPARGDVPDDLNNYIPCVSCCIRPPSYSGPRIRRKMGSAPWER